MSTNENQKTHFRITTATFRFGSVADGKSRQFGIDAQLSDDSGGARCRGKVRHDGEPRHTHTLTSIVQRTDMPNFVH
jgi:hypothetical protein